MYQPQVYGVALSFMLLSMLCWESWANTLKLAPATGFNFFTGTMFWVLIVAAFAWVAPLGSFGSTGKAFIADVGQARFQAILLPSSAA